MDISMALQEYSALKYLRLVNEHRMITGDPELEEVDYEGRKYQFGQGIRAR